MRKLLVAVCLAFGCMQAVWSASVGDLLRDVGEETRLTVGKSGTPAYYHDWRSGQQGFGLSTEVFAYRYFSGDVGYFTQLDAGLKGTAVMGGSLHIDRLIGQTFPNFTYFSKMIVPKSLEKFFNRLSLGVFFGYNFDRKDTAIGINSGLSFDL